MENQEPILNRVAKSALITFDLEDYYEPGIRTQIDLKEILFQGMILRENDLREYIKNRDWQQYENKFVAINCSVDAIIPTWAYMLVALAANSYAKDVILGTIHQLEEKIFLKKISQINWQDYQNAKVVIKGCSKISVPESCYVEVVNRLKLVASSIMFGEACSTVPLYKRPKG